MVHGIKGEHPAMITYIRRRYDLGPAPRPKIDDYPKRNREIVERYRPGAVSLRQLGVEFDLSPTRVLQIINHAKRLARRAATSDK